MCVFFAQERKRKDAQTNFKLCPTMIGFVEMADAQGGKASVL